MEEKTTIINDFEECFKLKLLFTFYENRWLSLATE